MVPEKKAQAMFAQIAFFGIFLRQAYVTQEILHGGKDKEFTYLCIMHFIISAQLCRHYEMLNAATRPNLRGDLHLSCNATTVEPW